MHHFNPDRVKLGIAPIGWCNDDMPELGAVVDGQQGAVPTGGVTEDLQRHQFVAGLQRAEPLLTGRTLIAQLDDVDPAGQRGVGELGQITAFPAGVGAQV